MSDITTKTHSAESGNWYDWDGKQVATVPNAKGDKQIKPDIRHARKLNLLPGITTILRVQDKPALTKWKVKQGILSALTLPRSADESEDQWLDRVLLDAEETGKKAAEGGTQIHAIVQDAFDVGIDDYCKHDDYLQVETVRAVRDLLSSSCGARQWIAERGFACSRGYGSKSDLHCQDFVLDIKTKEGDLSDVSVYDDHAMQLAATRFGLWENALCQSTARCGNLFLSRTHEKAAVIVWHDEKDLEKAGRMFECLHAFWKVKNGHFPERGSA